MPVARGASDVYQTLHDCYILPVPFNSVYKSLEIDREQHFVSKQIDVIRFVKFVLRLEAE